jgi:two-component system chemotaxis sensor kinase CheA
MDEKLRKRLLQTFKLEAAEHLQSIRNGLVRLENITDVEEKLSLLEEIYRDAHSLKGAARAVNLTDIVDLCQNVENIFAALKKQEIKENEEMFDLVQNSLAVIENFIEEEDENARILMFDEIQRYQILIDDFLESAVEVKDTGHPLPEVSGAEKKESRVKATAKEEKPKPSKEKKSQIADKPKIEVKKSSKKKNVKVKELKSIDTVRVDIKKLENILLTTEEMIPVKLAFSSISKELARLILMIEEWKTKWGKNKFDYTVLYENLEKLEADFRFKVELNKLMKFLDFNEMFAKDFYELLNDVQRRTAVSSKQLSNILFNLNSDVKNVLMLPFGILTDQFPSMMWDIAQELGKKIQFNISGEEIEIDKRILEELKDPLIHLLRNSIDHGIEEPEERIKAGKEEKGKVNLDFIQAGDGKVEIIISDDGRGMDADEIRRTAISKNLITEAEAEGLSESETLALIFKSDFSTAKVVTELSGRGLGMAIVRDKINKLGGSIKIETEKGKGSKFILSIPLVLTTIRGLIVESGGQTFAINVTKIQAVISRELKDIKTVENKETVEYSGKRLAIIQLSSLLDLPSKGISEEKFLILVLKFATELVGVVIERIVNEQEILLKPLPVQFKKLAFIEGATISSQGEIIPVLNVNDIFKFLKSGAVTTGLSAGSEGEKREAKKRILVVDDSITSRVLLSDILLSVGYDVTSKSDGKEAWAELNSNSYDLLVTDIEMPRMDGFELTKKIRESSSLSELPVVLVTGLSKKEDKEKGIEVGANAYIVKSDFKQGTLLDIIRKFV